MTPFERSEKLLNRISEWDFNRMNEGAMRAELESEPGNFREAEVYRRCISIIEDRSTK